MFVVFAGVAAGFLHVLAGPDHLAAVAPLAADRQRGQWQAGLQWGLGHTAGVVAIGVLLVAFRELLPIDTISSYSERAVGVALLVVGLWGLNRARVARHREPHAHASRGASFAMGALHGLAGSSHLFVGILPALALPTPSGALTYLGGFGIGAVLAMTIFSAFIGVLAMTAARRGVDTYRGVLYVCSVSAVVVGSFWLVAAN